MKTTTERDQRLTRDRNDGLSWQLLSERYQLSPARCRDIVAAERHRQHVRALREELADCEADWWRERSLRLSAEHALATTLGEGWTSEGMRALAGAAA